MATGMVKTEIKNRKFEIIIYEPSKLKTFYGHVEISINNTIYSYGRYDVNAVYGIGGVYGDGVLKKGTKDYILDEVLKERGIYIFEIALSDFEIYQIENFYENLIKYYGFKWEGHGTKDKKEYFKFKKIKYDVYEFLNGDNCATIIVDAVRYCGNKNFFNMIKNCFTPSKFLNVLLGSKELYKIGINKDKDIIKNIEHIKKKRVLNNRII